MQIIRRLQEGPSPGQDIVGVADRQRFFAALDREPQYPAVLAGMLGIENAWLDAACAPVTALLEHLVERGVLVRTGKPEHPAYATPRAARQAQEERTFRERYAQRRAQGHIHTARRGHRRQGGRGPWKS